MISFIYGIATPVCALVRNDMFLLFHDQIDQFVFDHDGLDD